MDNKVLLTLNQVAEYEDITYKAISKRVRENKLKAIKVPTSGGRRGYEYRLTIDQLSEKAKRKYYAGIKQEVKGVKENIQQDTKAKYEDITLLDLTEAQRQEIAFWEQIIKDYNTFLGDSFKSKTIKTKEYVTILKDKYPNKKISERTLRRKLQAYRDVGEVGLTDLRKQAKNKGESTINEIVLSIFLQHWLDEARPGVTSVYKVVEAYLQMELPQLLPLPSISAFYRATKNIPMSVERYFRHGEKKFEDDCLPYIEREYESFDSNEIWSADYHTLDFFVRDDVTKKVYRPHLIAWIDVRSRKVLSVSLMESSNSDGTIIAFRKAIMKYGIPKSVYLDNGREFLVHDFGGKGRRKKDSVADYGQTILQRLGVVMHNANVANAKAKVIERIFRNITFDFSKFVKTYVGGKPEQRPTRLKEILKNEENIPLVSEVREWIESYIEGWYNEQKSNAKGLKGQSPNESYKANLISKRTATREQLDLMLLRSSRLQQVKRNGVKLKIYGEDISFYNEELVTMYFGRKVYVRYNPENLTNVHVYDSEERYICEAEIVEKGNYKFDKLDEADVEAIKKLQAKKRKQKKIVKDYMENLKDKHIAPSAIDIIVKKSNENLYNIEEVEAQVLEPINFHNKKAVGYESSVNVDFSRMVQNAKNKK